MDSNVNVFLSDEDREEIARLTGNHGEGHFFLNPYQDEDEYGLESHEDSLDSYGVHEQKLEKQRYRNLMDLLTFNGQDMWGKPEHFLDDKGDKVLLTALIKQWFLKEFESVSGFALKFLGEKEGAWFLKRLQQRMADPDEKHLIVSELLGVPPEKIEPVNQKPGKVYFQEASNVSEGGRAFEDGRMQDEKEARSGWIQDEDGNWRKDGFSIPYVYGENKQPLEIMVERSVPHMWVDEWDNTRTAWEKKIEKMKVLNINICEGDKPSLKFYNLVRIALDAKMNRTVEQKLRYKKLLKMYQTSMEKKEAKTCRNGRYWVYYRSYRLDTGKNVCVFSPIPFSDLREDHQLELLNRRKAKREYEATVGKIEQIVELD